MRAFRSLRYNLKHGGVGLVLQKVTWRLRGLFYRTENWVLLERGLEGDLGPLPPARTGVRAEFMRMEQLLAHEYFKAVNYPEDLQSRFRAGDLCIGILLDDTLAHVAWLARGRLPLDVGLPSYRIPGGVGIYDMFTLEPFRRRGCQTVALEELNRRAAAEGSVRALSIVDPGNQASLSVFARCGFTPVSRLTYRRVLCWSRLVPRRLES